MVERNVVVCDHCGRETAEDDVVSVPVRTGRRGRPPILDLCPACAAQTDLPTLVHGTQSAQAATETAQAAAQPRPETPEAVPVWAAAAPPLESLELPLPVPVAGSQVIKNHAAFIRSVADLSRGATSSPR